VPTYEYECMACGRRFERRQPITEDALTECPECRGAVRRLISGGLGLIVQGSGIGRIRRREDHCSLEQAGKTCCGRDERCDKPQCGNKE